MGIAVKDPRERMANQLLMRGHASVDELLHASFGEWPPKGLDIAHKNPHRVTLITSEKGIYSWPVRVARLLTTCGSAGMAAARTIFINRLQTPFSGGTLITLSHETSHILQSDHGYRTRHRTGLNGLKAHIAAGDHTSAVMVKPLSSHVSNSFLCMAFRAVSLNNLKYLMMGEELQARIQEALTHGYPHWQRLPQNKDEFHFAMQSLGFRLTPQIQEHLRAHPQQAEIKKIFPDTPDARPPSCVREIEFVQKSLTAYGQNLLWGTTMCGLYCDLIEMYGDRHGRERFGYGPNETHILVERYKTDIDTLRAITWQHTQDQQGISHACTSIAQMTDDELGRLQAAASNACLKHGVIRTDTGAWMIIDGKKGRGESGLDGLRRLTGQAIVPRRDSAVLHPRATPSPHRRNFP